jgi:membrane protein implicated in regulation of membrane protease activity
LAALKDDWRKLITRPRALPLFMAMLAALTMVMMFDDVIFYLLFEHLWGRPVSWLNRLIVGILLTLFNLWLAVLMIKALKAKPKTGAEGMIGKRGVVVRVAAPEMWVKVDGELWRAEAKEPLNVGEKIIVQKITGLILSVERLDEKISNGEQS